MSIVILRITREWFCHEHAGVVNQRVDTTETLEGRLEHSLRRVRGADVALYGDDARIGDRLDRPRCRNNPVVPISESLNNAGGGYMNDFMGREFWRFVVVQQEVAKLAQTAIEYPPMQAPASFNLEAVKREIDEAIKKHPGD